jgi:hypothetical protein
MFWGAQGAGAHWPGGDAALLAIVPGVLLAALATSSLVSPEHRRTWPAGRSTPRELIRRP